MVKKTRTNLQLPTGLPNPPRWYVPEWLEFTGVTQAHIIEETGLSKGYVSDLVNGKERFNQDVLWVFAYLIGCPWGALLDINPLTRKGKVLAELVRARERSSSEDD